MALRANPPEKGREKVVISSNKVSDSFYENNPMEVPIIMTSNVLKSINSLDIGRFSPRDCNSDSDFSIDYDFMANNLSPQDGLSRYSYDRLSSAFTPIRKRSHYEDESPNTSVMKSLKFSLSTESSPQRSTNSSSVVDEFDSIPLNSTENLFVLSNCPPVSNFYENEFITVKRIGEGNFNIVEMVICKSNGSPYAIKRTKSPVLTSSERRRFVKEIRLFSEVNECPFLLQYYKSWQEDSYLYTLMECCTRGSLHDFIKIQQSIPEQIIWSVLFWVLSTLDFLHKHGIVHLDIKPENLLFTEMGEIRVGDLGCAAHIDDNSGVSDRRYMSLEGLEDEVTPLRDVFSLGIVIYEMMSKEEIPLSGEKWIAIRKESGIPFVSGYSNELNSIIQSMTKERNRPTAEFVLKNIPNMITSKLGETRAFIRTVALCSMQNNDKTIPSIVETTKVTKRNKLCISTSDRNEESDERSNMCTPVDVINSSCSLKFNF